MKKIYFILFILSISAFAGCKARRKRVSDQKSLSNVGDLLDIGKLSIDQQLQICSQNILIVFVGNAQALSRPIVGKHLGSTAEKEIYSHWVKNEIQLEQDYFHLVKSSFEDLKVKTESAQGVCVSNEMYEKLKNAGKESGNVTIVSLIDGPNTELWEQNGAKVKPDSSLQVLTYGFNTERNWKKLEQKYFKIENGKVLNAEENEVFEADVPKDFDVVQDWIKTNKSFLAAKRPFSQTSYIIKGHGGRLASSDYSGFFAKPTLDSALIDTFSPTPKSIFMIDPVRSATEENYATKMFFSPMWSPSTYCLGMCQYQGRNFEYPYNTCQKSCIETLLTEAKKEKNSFLRTIQNQTQGSVDDTQGSVDDTQGSVDDTQGGSSLTFSKNDWKSDTQGQKSVIKYSESKPGFSVFNGYPFAFRAAGSAKSLQSSVRPGVDTRLSLTTTSESPSMLLLDTCSVSMWSKQFDSALKDQVNLKPIDSPQAEFKPSLVMLANPMPLLKNAINYKKLDPFQIVLLAQLLAKSEAIDKEPLVQALLGEKSSDLPRQQVFSRLYASKFDCKTGNNLEAECLINQGLSNVYLKEQLAISSRSFKDRIFFYRKQSFEFNLSPAMGAGKRFREVMNSAMTAGLLDSNQIKYWNAVLPTPIEDVLVYGFADPSKYQNPVPPGRNNFTIKFGSKSWSALDKKVFANYQDVLVSVLNEIYSKAINIESTVIQLELKQLLNLSLANLASSISIYNGYFNIEDNNGISDPWQKLLRTSLTSANQIVNLESIKPLTKQQIFEKIKNLTEKADKIHSISGIFSRTTDDLLMFSQELKSLSEEILSETK